MTSAAQKPQDILKTDKVDMLFLQKILAQVRDPARSKPMSQMQRDCEKRRATVHIALLGRVRR
jgi:hypothetical protein